MLDFLNNLRKKDQPKPEERKQQTETLYCFVKNRFCEKFSEDDFDKALDEYYWGNSRSQKVQFITLLHVQYHLNEAIKALMLDKHVKKRNEIATLVTSLCGAFKHHKKD